MHHTSVIESNQLHLKLFLIINVCKYSSKECNNRIIYSKHWNQILQIFKFYQLQGYIEANPQPTKKTSNYFSCCPWNANSILGHNKISLLTAYHTVRRFNIICISETYLDSTVDDKTIEITGYNLIRAGQPNNQKRGGMFVFQRKLMPKTN